jgi:threonine 3-dehydrogenase
MVALIEAGLDISKVITHTFALEEYEKGFAAMASGRCGKVILNVS